jgi:hypothetical protein
MSSLEVAEPLRIRDGILPPVGNRRWPIANRPQLNKLFAMTGAVIDRDENTRWGQTSTAAWGLQGRPGVDARRRSGDLPHREFSRVPHIVRNRTGSGSAT